MSLQTQRLESMLDYILSNSHRDTYHINRFNELEIDYGNLESAFIDEHGERAGSYLFDDACEMLDLEEKAWAVNNEFAESRQLDFLMGDVYGQLSTMTENLYAKKTA